ncbi:hypothetical protein KZ829_38770 [Actinoplanes hulinensis]|uniref:Uncharacterized protein n=1 Tax=Actinoplanes hulinensis TaxID=1144547 RepID=A0ABS7BFQ1_9ACTN|nr:hypothetical protein [Actinoplanes hulinensis]MBW6439689.1 hypothetical protein [Actinoplanes hulinensis]
MTEAQQRHPASWWEQFPEASERFDTAHLTEGLGELINPNIASQLLRREAEIATEVMVRHLNKPESAELAERAAKSAERLVATLDRIEDRSGDASMVAEARATCHLLLGRLGEAAFAAEAFVPTQKVLRAFVGALRMERFDVDLAVRMLAAGFEPAAAIRSGQIVGKYNWWPSWLLQVITERAMDGQLDDETVEALDKCAYADLDPVQVRVARRLLAGEDALIDASAQRLEALGEAHAADKLRAGDLATVALAARLVMSSQ